MHNQAAIAAGTGRRALLAGMGGVGLATLAPREARAAAAASDLEQWLNYRRRFVTAEGRVLDTGNGGISHSEGQGYGLLLSEAFDDRASFDRLLDWTRRTLLRPEGLHAWRFRPAAGTSWPVAGVDDFNNASDGDIYIAWALLRAADRWNSPDYARMGLQLSQAISRHLLLEVQGRMLLLPGANGFMADRRVVLNPSYYAFPALHALGHASGDQRFQRVIQDGVALLRTARYGRWGLPADWLEVSATENNTPQPARSRPQRFSYDAVRVPLHLAWAGLGEEPAVEATRVFWTEAGGGLPPAWTDLRTGALGPERASGGVMAIARLAQQSRRGRPAVESLPVLAPNLDYYASSLTLLARLAAQEAPPPGMALLAPRSMAQVIQGPPAIGGAEKAAAAPKQEPVSFGRGVVRRMAGLLGAG